MTSFFLRRATADQQKPIKQLIRDVHINPIGLKWQQFIVALDADGEMVACGQVKSHRDGSRELASIAVKKGWRKQGVARAIIERLMTEHEPPLWLTCESRLVPFYQKFGFVEVKELEGMSPYFRRLSRIARLMLRFSKSQGYLAVMVWREKAN